MPVWPSERISLVDAILRDRRNIAVTSKSVGKELSSSGLVINKVVINMIIEVVTEKARKISSINVGIGKSKMNKTATTPIARATSVCLLKKLNQTGILEELSTDRDFDKSVYLNIVIFGIIYFFKNTIKNYESPCQDKHCW